MQDATSGNLDNLEGFKELITPNFLDAIERLTSAATDLNTVFGQNRQRISEMQRAISDSEPVVLKLGGTIDDAGRALAEISEGTRRNVLATSEDVSKLYAASKILNTDISTLVENFNNVGVQFSAVGEQLEKSISYIQSIGMNTSQIMKTVTNNMEKLNEFNFAGGVEGLTKMASQSTFFRFNMSDTFTVMNEALSPDGAIKLSSAFQRMGIAAGDLTDPFQLMYKSLNDPEGLQKSLSQMTKQFSYFDEKTKTFKISPEGMLQMRELSKQTGISYESLSKSSLAAANLDGVMRQMKPGFKFESEEDKQLLANVARMTKEGKYEIEMKGGQKIDIDQASPELLKQFLDEQKSTPKTVEEMQRNSLGITETIAGDVSAIRAKIEGTVTAPSLTEFNEMVRDFITSSTDLVEKEIPKGGARDELENVIQQSKKIYDSLAKGDTAGAAKTMQELEGRFEKLSEQGGEKMVKLIEKLKDNFGEVKSKYDIFREKGGKSTTKPKPKGANKVTLDQNINGNFNFKVDAGNANTKQIEQFLNSSDFREAVFNVIKNMDSNTLATLRKTLKLQ